MVSSQLREDKAMTICILFLLWKISIPKDPIASHWDNPKFWAIFVAYIFAIQSLDQQDKDRLEACKKHRMSGSLIFNQGLHFNMVLGDWLAH